MGSPQLADDAVQVVLLSKCRHAALAAGPVARHFGLTAGRAEALLEDGHGVIAAQMPMASVRKILPLCAALGVHLALRPIGAEPELELFDLSLRSLTTETAGSAVQELKRLGFASLGPASDFAGASGLVLSGLTEARAKVVALALRSLSGIKVTVSGQGTASYDLFLRQAETAADLTALRRHLCVLGCLNSGPAPTLATGLDQRTLQHLLARFPRIGLFGVNQMFQRYDLRLVGRGRLSTRELHDFLVTRGVFEPQAGLALTTGHGMTVESGLSRAAAGQFLSDYAAIGLTARAELVLI